MQPAAGPARALTNHDDVATHRVRWTPDGRWVVYSADRGLWRISPDGGASTRIPFRARVRFGRERPALRPVRFPEPGSDLVVYLSTSGLRIRLPGGGIRPVPWPLRYRAREAPPPLLVRGARIIDGRGSPLSEPSDLLMRGGRIDRIAPAGSLQESGGPVLDATGQYMLPGFIDLHAHIWDDASLPAWLHNGITTVRDIASQRLKTADLRNIVEAGIREGPRIVYAGAMFHNGAGYSTLGDQMVSEPADIARAVAINAGMDAAYTKERGFAQWHRAATIIRESHRYGIPVSGHCAHILPVVAAGIDGAKHVLNCFPDSGPLRGDYAALARASGLWIVPTLAVRLSIVRAVDDPTLLDAEDVAPFLNPQHRSLYSRDSETQSARPTHLAAGTDNPFPIGIHHELEALVESGLSPAEALVAATGGAARVLNAPDIGTIAPGQWADAVLLEANPLDDIRNTRRIRAVIQGGRIIDREGLRRKGFR